MGSYSVEARPVVRQFHPDASLALGPFLGLSFECSPVSPVAGVVQNETVLECCILVSSQGLPWSGTWRATRANKRLKLYRGARTFSVLRQNITAACQGQRDKRPPPPPPSQTDAPARVPPVEVEYTHYRGATPKVKPDKRPREESEEKEKFEVETDSEKSSGDGFQSRPTKQRR